MPSKPNLGASLPPTPRHWRTVLNATLCGACALVAMEWLFFVTKPSFLSQVPWSQKITTLAVTPAAFWVPPFAAILAVGAVTTLTRRASLRTAWRRLSLLPSVAMFAALVLLLTDNFTITLFGFGIERTSGMWRYPYMLLFVAAVWAGLVIVRGLVLRLDASRAAVGRGLAAAMLLPSLLAMGIIEKPWRDHHDNDPGRYFADLGELSRRPNVLLLSSDGLDATHMSAYGYGRQTTPYLDELMHQSLLCENAFSNAANTPASLASLLTGRLPTQTRLIFTPDILTGDDVYRHLPGFFRAAGYRNLHISIRHYADAFDLNLRSGFHESTFRKSGSDRLRPVLGENASYFFEQIWSRVTDRARHVFMRQPIRAAVLEIKEAAEDAGVLRQSDTGDSKRVGALIDFMAKSETPFFAQVHLMTTHGPTFPITRKVFSRNKSQTSNWLMDFYDDAVLAFDGYLATVFEALKELDKLDDTLVVVHSDHGSGWDGRKRVPLLFFFPGVEHTGRIKNNVQNIDIAPTILDYLGLSKPHWMLGQSVLAGEPATLRPAFGTEYDKDALRHRGTHVEIDAAKVGPPFYSLRRATMVVGNRSYRVDLVRRDIQSGEIEGHTQDFETGELPDPKEAFLMILRHLEQNGYDVSSFTGTPGKKPSP